MIVDKDDRRGRKLQRSFHHFARIDRGVIDRAGLLHFIGDQRILLVEKQDADVFPSLDFCCRFKWLRKTSPKRPLRVPYDVFFFRFVMRSWATRLVCSSVPRL